MFVDIRDPASKKLLFRFDGTRNLIEIKVNGSLSPILIDLNPFQSLETIAELLSARVLEIKSGAFSRKPA